MRPGRPRWAELLLRLTLPDDVRGRSIKGDLDQEHDELRARSGRSHDLWYGWESSKLALGFGLSALTTRRSDDGMGMTERMGRDLRYGARRLRKSPGFSLIAVATIAIGIGANVAIFSVVNAVLLAPLPYEDPDDLVAVWEHRLESGNDRNVANPGNLRDWRERAGSFQAMAGASMTFPHVLEGSEGPKEVQASGVEHHFFSVLGVEPALGRDLVEDGGTQIILTHDFWLSEYGGDPTVVGRSLRIDGTTGEVVGVLPDRFIVWGDGIDLYYGNSLAGADRTNSGRWLQVIGRLSEGASVERAREEMLAIAGQLREEDPEFNAGWSVNVLPLKTEVVGESRPLVLVLMGAVGLLLLIACANVANLLLARGTGRRQEMAVRRSLGASGTVLGRQLLLEAGVLAAVGTVLGLAVAHLGSRYIVQALPSAFGLPRAEEVALNLPVLLFTAGAAILTTALFGLLPAVQAGRVAPACALAGESRGPGRRSGRARSALVVAEVAVSMMLLAGATLMTRSFVKLVSVDPGIRAEGALTGRVALSGPAYDDDGARIEFARELQERLERIPGVEAAGGTSWLPFTGLRAGTSYWRSDLPKPPNEDRSAADILNVTGDYFTAMGVQIVRGRGFDERDREDSPRVAVVNQTLASALWPGEDPLGRRLTYSWSGDETVEVVGVVADVRADGLREEVDEAIYMPMSQTPYFEWNNLVVRTSVEPTSIVPQLREAVRSIDSSIPVSRVQVMEDLLARSVARPRVSATLMAVFAVAAALLAAIGLYGVLSYTVARRVREIGVRIALGARPRSVLAMVLRSGMAMIAMGLVAGLVGALAVTRVLESLLFEVGASDPMSLFGSALLLLVAGLVACVVPALRATRVAPATALNSE